MRTNDRTRASFRGPRPFLIALIALGLSSCITVKPPAPPSPACQTVKLGSLTPIGTPGRKGDLSEPYYTIGADDSVAVALEKCRATIRVLEAALQKTNDRDSKVQVYEGMK
jgi:hypothetical protein